MPAAIRRNFLPARASGNQRLGNHPEDVVRISVWTRNGAAALACIAALGTASAAEAQYTYSKIMYPGSTWTEASSVNDSGQVVGTYTDTAGTAHGFLFHNGTYTTVDHPDRAHNYLFGINDQGK